MDFHPTVKKIENLLKKKGVWYERFEHEEVRTSAEAALVRKNYTLGQGAKALIVRIKKPAYQQGEGGKKEFAMIVLSGDKRFDTKKAKEILGAKDIRFATEEEVLKITKGVKPGGVPPFGNLFDLTVYADEHIFNMEKIIFNAGDRSVSIGMRPEDYRKIVDPNIVSIT